MGTEFVTFPSRPDLHSVRRPPGCVGRAHWAERVGRVKEDRHDAKRRSASRKPATRLRKSYPRSFGLWARLKARSPLLGRADPATDEGDHVTNLLALMDRGVVDLAEVRNALGFAPLTEEQEAEKQEANDMKKQEMETRMAELNNGGDDDAGEEEDE